MSQWLGAYGWGYAAAAFAAWTLVLAVLARIDRRRIDGENTWSKPFKFSSSLAIHFATFAVLTHHLPADDRNGAPLLSTFVAAFAAAGFAQAYITVQAARRRRSHFNTTTPIEATMLALTGLCAVVVLAPAVVIGLDALVDPLIGWTAAERAGVAIGLLAGSLLTTVTGFQMGSAGSHFVGRPSSEPRMMRLTGWSLDAPDLRPAHFLANHMMQAAPLAGVVFTQLLKPLPALMLTVAFCCGWAWSALAMSRHAMADKSLPTSFHILARPIPPS